MYVTCNAVHLSAEYINVEFEFSCAGIVEQGLYYVNIIGVMPAYSFDRVVEQALDDEFLQ